MSLSTLSLSFGSSALTCLQDQLLHVSIAHLLTWFCGAYSTRFKAPVDTTPTLPWCYVVHMCVCRVMSCHVWQAVGWIVGFVMGDFMYTLAGWAAGMVLSIIVS